MEDKKHKPKEISQLNNTIYFFKIQEIMARMELASGIRERYLPVAFMKALV